MKSKGLLSGKKIRQTALKWIKEAGIKCTGPKERISQLSGGNAQKVIFARVLESGCKVLILNHPTRGVDVGAKQEIYNLMCKLVEAGKSIIMISSEMPELIGMSDRIVVMSNGENAGELSKGEYDQTHLLEMASSKL